MPNLIKDWCHHYPNNSMPDLHICDALIALVGEAPGRVEDESGQPFVGASGWDLSQWWKAVGLKREDFYITNTYPIRPPDNKLELIPIAEREKYCAEMLWRLKRQPVNVVVPCGNYALRAVMGEPRWNISDWRGSILPWNGRKIIPTIHPAATQRQKILTKLCVADWKRIASEANDRRIEPIQRNLIIDPSIEEINGFDSRLQSYFDYQYQPGTAPRVLSVDVENLITGDRAITCVGFSYEPRSAITISTLRKDYEDELRFNYACNAVRRWLGRGYSIVGQNFQTDLWKLIHWDSSLKEPLCASYHWDLMEIFHCLDPNDGGGTEEGSEGEVDDSRVRVGMLDLATLTSLYTKQPYYKHLGSSPIWETRQQYNALDACIQRELFDVGWSMLNERGLV